eukprot:TRINITY_DN847_c0_g1_i2.p1 TRINITY_DN847_c0_g1~~TRINITY_DN847_c0_g1_i2.p1  ORF type:complete len:289 (+),score=39.66 TRINITY_DN847_c0_g1_i2:46-912(+)
MRRTSLRVVSSPLKKSAVTTSTRYFSTLNEGHTLYRSYLNKKTKFFRCIPKGFFIATPLIVALSVPSIQKAYSKPNGPEAVVVESLTVAPTITTTIIVSIASSVVAGGFGLVWGAFRSWRSQARFFDEIRWSIPHTPEFLKASKALKKSVIIRGAIACSVLSGFFAFGMHATQVINLTRFKDYASTYNSSNGRAVQEAPSRDDVLVNMGASITVGMGYALIATCFSPFVVLPAFAGLFVGAWPVLIQGKTLSRLENFQRTHPDVPVLVLTPNMELENTRNAGAAHSNH